MGLVNAKCTNCGAVLEVEKEKDAMICNYCGSAFVVEKAINEYKITNNVTNNINAGVVNVVEKSKDFIIKGGILEKYEGEETKVVIPNNVVVIGKEAFKDMSAIESIEIPDSVVEICDNAFQGCKKLKEILIPDSVANNVGKYLFEGCSNLEKVIIPDDLYINIPEGLFCNCSNLKFDYDKFAATKIVGKSSLAGTSIDTIKYFKKLEKIESYGFGWCKKIKEILINENIKTVGFKAFTSCINLEKVVIFNDIQSVDFGAFSSCENLKDITICGKLDVYGDNVFEECRNIENVKILNNNEDQYISFSKLIAVFRNSSYIDKIDNSYYNRRCIFCGAKKPIFNFKIKCSNCGMCDFIE